MVIIRNFFERFQYLTLKQIFWKKENFFIKLMEHLILKEIILKTQHFHKKETSETNVKTNKIESTKWTYHKEQSFASNYFIFLKFCFTLRIYLFIRYLRLIVYKNSRIKSTIKMNKSVYIASRTYQFC